MAANLIQTPNISIVTIYTIRPVRLTKEETINVLETNMATQMLHLVNNFLQVNTVENRHEPQPVSFCLIVFCLVLQCRYTLNNYA